jgi:hypothetical protein
MVRNSLALLSLSFLLNQPFALLAGPVGGQQVFTTLGDCADCVDQIPLLASGTPLLPGEERHGAESCTLVTTSDEWDALCRDNAIPDCRLLDDVFFRDHTVLVVAIDTVTSRPCEGSPDPLWKLDCVSTADRGGTVRLVEQRPGSGCRCSMMPQYFQRLFLASAVPRTAGTECRICEEPHTVGCLR